MLPAADAKELASAKSQIIGIACRPKQCCDLVSPTLFHRTRLLPVITIRSTANAKIHRHGIRIGRRARTASTERIAVVETAS